MFIAQPKRVYSLKKLQLYGSKNYNANYEWPKSLADLGDDVRKFKDLKVKTVWYQKGSGTTGDIRFELNNGKTSEAICGHLNSAKEKLELDQEKRLKCVKMLENDNCFNQFEFIYDDGKSVLTTKYYERKEWREQEIKENQVLVGCYGYKSGDYFYSIGLIVL